MKLSKNRTHNGNNISGMSKMLEAKNPFELLKAHHRRGSAHEPDYRRMR